MIPDEEPVRWHRRVLQTPIGLLIVGLVLIWVVEIVDTVALGARLQRHGIHPRQADGLDGIVWAPFLHSDFGHVASNSVPLLALGGLVAIRGMRYWARVTAVTVVVGGGLTWMMAGGSNHIGASGVVFGYLGAVLGAAVFERRPKALAPAFLAVGFYSGMLAGLVPQEFISWEGHLFGLIAGILAARWMAEPRRPRGASVDNVQAWELDEPWLD